MHGSPSVSPVRSGESQWEQVMAKCHCCGHKAYHPYRDVRHVPKLPEGPHVCFGLVELCFWQIVFEAQEFWAVPESGRSAETVCKIIGDTLVRGPLSDCFTQDLQLGVYNVLFCDGFVELPSITKRKTFSSSDMGPISSSRCLATSNDKQRVESCIEALDTNWKTRPSVRQVLFVTLVAWV